MKTMIFGGFPVEKFSKSWKKCCLWSASMGAMCSLECLEQLWFQFLYVLIGQKIKSPSIWSGWVFEVWKFLPVGGKVIEKVEKNVVSRVRQWVLCVL